MATPLLSLIVRESTEKVDDRNILVALTEDQRISFRLKGMKSGVVSIPIAELYAQLTGTPSAKPKPVSFKRQEKNNDELSISINRLRALNHVTPSDPHVRQRLEELLTDFEEEMGKQTTFKNKSDATES